LLTYFQSIVMGLLQGVTELFPVSSLGHSVIFPTLFGWTNLVKAQSDPESFFLAFLVGLHLATALALVIFYWKEWLRIFFGFFSSIRNRKITTPDERLAWLLIVATIPTGAIALLLEHSIRTIFSKPLYASLFLILNGAILFVSERMNRKNTQVTSDSSLEETTRSLGKVKFRDAGLIGVFQTASLLAGISRSGITLVGGLFCRLSHQDAARFSFLLATPIILLAGLYKIPDLLGPNGDGVRPQIFAGSLVAGLAAYFSVRFLDKYFQKRKTTPYAVYCLVIGVAMTVKLLVFP
jgi:undecaprenyl-diphosphatase